MQRCRPDGSAWSACEGAVGPSVERCNGADDDCNGAVDDQRRPRRPASRVSAPRRGGDGRLQQRGAGL
ncbi:MAG: hypothetical protein R3F43_23660 [bacterium]